MILSRYTFFIAAALLAAAMMLFPSMPAFAAQESPAGIFAQAALADNVSGSALPPPPGGLPRTWDNTYPPRPPRPPVTPPQPRPTWPHPGYNTWGTYPGGEPDYYLPPTVIYQQPQQTQAVYYVPVVSSFTANPSYLEYGQTANLSWTVSNADTVTISPSIGTVPSTGSFAVMPTSTTTYTLIASNNQGTVSASTTVTVAAYAAYYNSGSAGTAASTGTADSGSTLVTSGVSAGNTATANTLLMYLLLLSLLAVAAGVIVYLMVKKPAVAHAHSGTGLATGYPATSVGPAATLPATAVSAATSLEASLPAKFVSPAGTLMPVTGKPMGRSDFQALMTPEKAELVSRKHMQVTYENSQYWIEDFNSTNGTRLNGSEIRGSGKHVIASGDTIEIANILRLTFKI